MENEVKNELQLQAQCSVWFQNECREYRGRFRRVKNETDHFGLNARSRIAQGVENRTTGIVKGTWDSFLISKPMLWIEFKFGNGQLSADQKEFAKMGLEVGWHFAVVRTLKEFQDIIKLYLNG